MLKDVGLTVRAASSALGVHKSGAVFRVLQSPAPDGDGQKADTPPIGDGRTAFAMDSPKQSTADNETGAAISNKSHGPRNPAREETDDLDPSPDGARQDLVDAASRRMIGAEV
jgi:hypothetical protein